MVRLERKIKAATLVEAIVAMVIIMICFGISLMIFLNVGKSFNTGLSFNALLIMDEIAGKTKAEKRFIDEDLSFENLIVSKKILPYNEMEDIRILDLKAYDMRDSLIIEKKELIIVK